MTKYGSIAVNDDPETEEGGCVDMCNTVMADDDSVAKPSAHGHHHLKPSAFRLLLGGMVALAVFVLFGIRKDNSNNAFPMFYDPTITDISDRSIENIPLFFTQKVDHLDPHNEKTWKQRYYAQAKHFQGPGHPVILVVGGEDANDDGFFYPFVEEHLAGKFGAFVVFPEHRFYGVSQPVDPAVATTDDLKHLFTANQAILDMLSIVQSYQQQLGCSTDKSSPEYCPVISVGGVSQSGMQSFDQLFVNLYY